MSVHRKVSVELTDEMASAVQGAVEAGDYPNPGEAIRAALDAWSAVRRSRNENLRRLIVEGVESGPGEQADTAFDRLEARYAALAAGE